MRHGAGPSCSQWQRQRETSPSSRPTAQPALDPAPGGMVFTGPAVAVLVSEAHLRGPAVATASMRPAVRRATSAALAYTQRVELRPAGAAWAAPASLPAE